MMTENYTQYAEILASFLGFYLFSSLDTLGFRPMKFSMNMK